MTFYNNNIQYRVTLDTDANMFVVYDAINDGIHATGITIEKAIQELKKSV